MGTSSSRTTATASPPLAVPSSLVRTRPVTPAARANSRPWARPLDPTVAPRTSRLPWRAPGEAPERAAAVHGLAAGAAQHGAHGGKASARDRSARPAQHLEGVGHRRHPRVRGNERLLDGGELRAVVKAAALHGVLLRRVQDL